MDCEGGGCLWWSVAQAGGVRLGCERIRWGWLGRTGGVLVAVALVASVLALSERAVIAQEAPSVSVSADAAGALAGDVLLFTVAASVPVEGHRGSPLTDYDPGYDPGLGVRVLVAEDGNVDVDADGTPEAGSGVLLAAQQGERSVVIPPGESEVVVAVETVGAAGSGSVTVTVTVLEPDGGDYTVPSSSASASTVVRDDGADAVVFWSAADAEPILATRPVELAEEERLDVAVRVVTDAAVEPRGFFSLQMRADPGTTAPIDYQRLPPLVHFGSGSGANRDAAPFRLTSDGLRYAAVAPVRFFTTNDAHYELAETLELVVERTDGVPATVRLGAGGASRLPILLFNNDYAEADITSVEPGDGTLTVTWEYVRESGPFVQQTELQWRRSGQTEWPADGTGLFATGTTAEIPGLDNGVAYELRARPIVPDGRSLWPYEDFRLGTGTPRSDVTTPSVGISAGATEATEGTALGFTVRAGAPVSADVDVAVVVAEDGNVDTDDDGVVDATSGVLHPAQEGRRVITIAEGESEAVVPVRTASDDAWENHATVTVTVSPSDDSTYVVDAATSSASTRVLDDDVPTGEVSLRVARFDNLDSVDFDDFDGLVPEGDLGVAVEVTFQTAVAEEPHGIFGVDVRAYDGTTRDDYLAADQTVSFGSGSDAPADAVPFTLSEDGQRYEASATFPLLSLVNDGHFELDETFDIALERTPNLPGSVRLAAGTASRVTVTILNDDTPLVSFDERENPPLPGDHRLKVSWTYDDDPNNYITQFAVRWRRSDGTAQSERREWGSEETEQFVDSTPGVYTDEGTIDIVGLENGVLYEIGVRPVVEIGNYQIGEWRVTTGTPGSNVTVPSVGVSAAAAEATEGDVLSFTVRAGAPVTADVDVAVVVAEDGNVDTDNDGTADAASGVLPAAQEGRRVVTIPAGSGEATLSVLTAADEAWENHATVTVTVSPPDDSAYAVDASASSALTRVLDDDVPGGEVSLSVSAVRGSFSDGGSGSGVVVAEGDGPLFVMARFVTDRAEEPHGVFGVRLMTYPVTAEADDDYTSIAQVVNFGSGADAPADAIPFRLSADGLRYEATAIRGLAIIDDPTIEVPETFDVAVERVPGLPSEIRLGAGEASRARVTVMSDDVGLVSDLRVAPGDRRLIVSWGRVDELDDDAEADGLSVDKYGVRWRPFSGEDPSDRDPFGPEIEVARTTFTVVGLDNGTQYEVEVRPIPARDDEVGFYFHSNSTTGTPAVAFVVAEASGPRVVSSGGNVSWTLELKHPSPIPRPDPLLEDLYPFANQPIRAFVSAGPSATAQVRCLPVGAFYPTPECVTDDEGMVRLVYRAAAVRINAEVGVDELVVFADYDGDGQLDDGEASTERTVGSTKVVRPINLVALGDSYSAGENGKPTVDRSNGFTGYYLSASGDPAMGTFTHDFVDDFGQPQSVEVKFPVDAPCRRWTKAYSQRLSSLGIAPALRFSDENRFRACTGAISLNIHFPPTPGATLDLDEAAYSTYEVSGPHLDGTMRVRLFAQEVDRPTLGELLGPSIHYSGEEGDRRQVGSLTGRRAELSRLREDVDMVVLTIGGNDIQFSSILEDCFLSLCLELERPPSVDFFPPEQFNSKLKLGDWPEASLYDFDPILGELTTRLDLVFSKPRDSAGDASIFVLGYPHLVPSDVDFVRTCDLANFSVEAVTLFGGGIDNEERGFIRAANVLLNATISGATERAGLHFVPVADAFAGHEPCTSETPWINGLVVDPFQGLGELLKPGDRSFHPNQLGHLVYALALRSYVDAAIDAAIDDVVADGGDLSAALNDALNAAGLPVNPEPTEDSSDDVVRSARAGGVSGSVGGVPGGESGDTVSGEGDSGESTDGSTVEEFVVHDVLSHSRLVPVGALCGALFVSPAEVVVLSAAGFAADAAVAVSMRSAAAPWETVSESNLAVATADDEGRLEVQWTVPVVLGESVPRGYAFEVSGAGASGGTLVARSLVPLVVYPGVAPCAVGDAASTMVGRAVRVAVLGNDVAPAGGSLVAASVAVDAVEGASVSVDATDGAVTVMPDPGFVGTIVVPYRVADNWGIRVGAAVTVTVEAGCTITGTVGVELIEGTAGDDVICVPDFADPGAFHIIDAKGGDDVIVGGNGTEWVDAGAGDDVVYGSGGPDRIGGGSGADTIYSGSGADVVFGDDLVDVVHDDDGYEFLVVPPAAPAVAAPVAGDDAAHTSAGETLDIAVLDNDHDPNENLVATSLSITTAPTLGAAYVVVSGGGEVVVRYVAGDSGGVDSFTYRVCDTLDSCASATVTVTVGTTGCTIVGTEGDDVLSGTAGPDVICGLGGNDVIYGRGGDDVLVGAAGDDTLFGGDGDDVLFGGAGGDDLYGGAGVDTLWGGAGGDALEGNGGDDVLYGGPGVDGLIGGGGADVLWGGAGGDSLIGHAGDDILHGGSGDDTLTGGNGEDTLWGGPGNDSLTGGANDDTLRGGGGDDTLWGNTQNDTLRGGAGNDTLRGGGHDDSLVGNSGDDTVYGNAGDDRLWGGTGGDTLDGGNGSDYADGGNGVDDCRRADTTARCEP